jgi:hypothetical protein
MKTIAVKDLVPGMLVARDVVSEQGMVLLNGGTCLTPNLIANLQKREVVSVCIEDNVCS